MKIDKPLKKDKRIRKRLFNYTFVPQYAIYVFKNV